MRHLTIQEYLAKQELLEAQNITKVDIDGAKLENTSNSAVTQNTRRYGSRDVCNGVVDWREITVADLYRPEMDCFTPSIIGCFMMSDDWNQQALLALKTQIGADFLVGLQTQSSERKPFFECLDMTKPADMIKQADMIKAIIKCQPDQVNEVIKLLDVYSPRYGMCLNVADIKDLFECSRSFSFIEVSATGNCKSDVIKIATQQLISQLPSADHIKGIFVNPERSDSLALAEFAYIADTIEALYNDIALYYSDSFSDEPNCFCLRALYAEA